MRKTCGGVCGADKAVDGDPDSASITGYSDPDTWWWIGELERYVKIRTILVYLGIWEFKQGYYKNFKVLIEYFLYNSVSVLVSG